MQVKKKEIRVGKSIFLKGFITAYVVLIVFFFSSKLWYPGSGEVVEATPIGTQVVYHDRDITLNRWDYSPSQSLMEIELQMLDRSTDGKDLVFEAVERTKGNIKTKTIYDEGGLVVIRLIEVPEKWNSISFRIRVSEDNGEALKIYTNNKAVNTVEKIKDLTQEEYYQQRLEREIKEYEQLIEDCEKDIENLLEKCDNANENINDLVAGKKYQTEKQQQQTDVSIQALESQIDSYEKEIAEIDGTIRGYEKEIQEIKKKLE